MLLRYPTFTDDEHSMNFHRSPLLRAGLLFLLIVIAVALADWRTLSMPFVQDDWATAWAFEVTPTGDMVRSLLDFRGDLVYRPLSFLYQLLVYKLFGANPLPSRLFMLLVHCLNAMLAAAVIDRLTHKRLLAAGTGLIYATAVAVHLDLHAWGMTSMIDQGSAFFLFFTLWLWLRKRYAMSALTYLLGMLFKESVVVTPLILGGVSLLQADTPLSWKTPKEVGKSLLPHAAVIGAYLVVKSQGVSLFFLPSSHPYAFSLDADLTLRHIFTYAVWMFQSLVPYGSPQNPILLLVANNVLLVGGFSLWLIAHRQNDQRASNLRLLGALVWWIICSLLPVVFLAQHEYRYYVTFGLPAFIAIALLLFDNLVDSVNLSARIRNGVLSFVVMLVVSASIIQANRIYAQGLKFSIMADGTNLLVKRAAVVRVVWEGLLSAAPNPKEGTVFLLGNVDLWAFDKDSGPRLWYGDNSIRVYPLESLRGDETGYYIKNPVEGQIEAWLGSSVKRRDIDPASTFIFRFKGGVLRPIAWEKIPPAEAMK